MEISPFPGIEHVGIGLDCRFMLDHGSASSDCIDLEPCAPAYQRSSSIAWSGLARERSPPCPTFALSTGKLEAESSAVQAPSSRQLSWQQLMGTPCLTFTPHGPAAYHLAPLSLVAYRDVQYRHEQIALGIPSIFNLENEAVETVRKSTYDYGVAAPDFILTAPISEMDGVVPSPNPMSQSVRDYVNSNETHERLAYDLRPERRVVPPKGHQPSPSPASSISLNRHQRTSPPPNALYAGAALEVDSDENRLSPDIDVKEAIKSMRETRNNKSKPVYKIHKTIKLRRKH